MTHAVIVMANGCIIKNKAAAQQQDKTPLISKNVC
jgi:hypothetical protein